MSRRSQGRRQLLDTCLLLSEPPLPLLQLRALLARGLLLPLKALLEALLLGTCLLQIGSEIDGPGLAVLDTCLQVRDLRKKEGKEERKLMSRFSDSRFTKASSRKRVLMGSRLKFGESAHLNVFEG
jgi:hypothetical protein